MCLWLLARRGPLGAASHTSQCLSCSEQLNYSETYAHRGLRLFNYNHLRCLILSLTSALSSAGVAVMLSELRRRYWNYTLNSFLVHFCYLFDSLAFVSCCFYCLLMLILFSLFWTYIWNIQWRWSLYVQILCGLLSCDINPIYNKCCHVFAHRYTHDYDSECSMDYELPLPPKVFLLQEWTPHLLVKSGIAFGCTAPVWKSQKCAQFSLWRGQESDSFS